MKLVLRSFYLESSDTELSEDILPPGTKQFQLLDFYKVPSGYEIKLLLMIDDGTDDTAVDGAPVEISDEV